MKKWILRLILFAAGFSLFAQNEDENAIIPIFVQPVSGVGHNLNDSKFITQMLNNEIGAKGFPLLRAPLKADFIVYGSLVPFYRYEVDKVKNPPPAPITFSYNASITSSEERYVFQLTLKNAHSQEILLQQNLSYTSFEDVYNFFPVMMYNLFNTIAETSIDHAIDDWQNKWLYIRASIDFPVTFYILQKDGLFDGKAIYNSSGDVSPVDNKVMALPGATVGFELQFLDFLSIEPVFKAGWEHLNEQDYITMTVGASVKVPVKFRNIMLEPYGAVLFPVYQHPLPGSIVDIFPSFPKVAFGGGLQTGLKGGKVGSIFLDINYMYYLGDAVMKNPHTNLYPEPPVIHYKRSVIGLGVGYKFGFFTRN